MTSKKQSGEEQPGIDVEAVTSWYKEHVPGVQPPLTFSRVPGGRSNLTFIVTDGAGSRTVLRRPPVSHLLPTAHDMNREQRIMSALGPTDVPVPPVLGYCPDTEVTGQPFYVMDFVEGRILRSAREASKLTVDQRAAAGRSLIEVLGRIHAVDPDDVGLGDLGRKEGYIARQLKRWHGQFTKSKTREVPLVDEMHSWLSDRIPEQGPAGIVHGDYRLDNTMVGPDGQIVAVLDWELCTLGDRMADLAMLLVYWRDRGEGVEAGGRDASTLDGFPLKTELARAYGDATGADLYHLDFYLAFGWWKLACIADGVYTRFNSGAMGDDPSYSSADPVPGLAATSRAAADRYESR